MSPKLASLVVLLLVIHVPSSSADDGSQFIYQGFTASDLALDGFAAVTPGGLLALTNATLQTKAHAFRPFPVYFLNASSTAAANATAARARSFSTCFVFAIVSDVEGLSDHGLAFVVAPTTNFSAAKAGQYLGILGAINGPATPLVFSNLPVLPRVGPKPRSKVRDVLLPLASALLVAAVLAAVFFVVWRWRRYAEVREDWEDEFGLHRFSYKDLFHATNGFNDSNLLGVGGFGRVYRGVLPVPSSPSLEIAVKRVSHDSRQGVREFVAEVVSIGRLRHRNLVQLLGYCRRKGELILVYDYMANGSLDKYLYDQQVPALSWHERYRIIKGVAASLLYLHEDWEQVVIHRDVKASNVLVDHEMNGRLGDFGLARLYDHGADPQTTHVVGTMGYLAPELVRTGKATPSTDVFAFGVFLLEVACGRRPIDRGDHGGRVVLVAWVIEHHRNGSLLDAVDPRLVGKYEAEEATLVLQLGLMCAHPWPNVRPSMRRVVQYLDSDQTLPLPDLTPSYTSYSKMSLVQNDGFDSYILSSGSGQSLPSMTSIGLSSVSVLSVGR